MCQNAKAAQELKNNCWKSRNKRSAENEKRKPEEERIIIFNVPHWVPEDQVTSKLTRILGVNNDECNEDFLKLMKRIAARNEKIHFPVTLSEHLADQLLNKWTVYLEFKECPVKNFVTIQKSHHLGFDNDFGTMP